MNKKVLLTVVVTTFFFTANIKAQDLSNMFPDTTQLKQHIPVTATFKSTRIISAHTNETVKKHNLDFRISHRFGNIGPASGGNVYDLYGFYLDADILISFEYGITDRLMVGASSSKRFDNTQGFVKYKALIQTKDNHVPVSLTLFANTVATYEKDPDGSLSNGLHRLSYVYEGIIARKMSPNLSLELIPTLFHRNYVPSPYDENDIFCLGGGFRWKFSRRSAIVAEYYYEFSKYRQDAAYRHANNITTAYYAPLGIGYEIETGGHVFTLMLANSAGIIENDFLVNTTDSWLKGGIKFSFNISRMFTLGGNKGH